MSFTPPLLTPTDTKTLLEGTGFVHLAGRLYGSFDTRDFAAGLELVRQVGELAESIHHHPDVMLGYGTVAFTLRSHDVGGVTGRDTELARQIRELVEPLSITSAERRPDVYEIGIDCVDAEAIRGFWRAATGFVDQTAADGERELADPQGRAPTIWFQPMDPPRTGRNRIHLDVYVSIDDAESRVRDVLDAGGRLVTDQHAPNWWVLADAEGNEACICTSRD